MRHFPVNYFYQKAQSRIFEVPYTIFRAIVIIIMVNAIENALDKTLEVNIVLSSFSLQRKTYQNTTGCLNYIRKFNGNLSKLSDKYESSWQFWACYHSWKVSKYWFFLVRIFLHPYLYVFSPNAGKYRPEKNPYLDAFHGVYWRTECIEVVAISYFVNDNIFERKVIYFLEKLSCNINPIHVIARHRITKKNDRVIVKLSQRNFWKLVLSVKKGTRKNKNGGH